MGAVYKGHDLQADRPVAVKILSSTLSAEQESIRRFLRGAQMAKRLVHPHIVELYDVGESEGIYYIAMEFVDGPTALDAMAAGRLDEIRKVLRIAIQVTQGLVHAHERQVVHRDIKPSNIMITRSDVTKLTDMGLAKSLEEAGVSRITESGVGMGTVDYVSPEQLDDARRVDHRGDIYSLGATLFHLLTGEVVFSSRNVVEKMKRIRDEAPRIPTELNGNVPRSLSGVVVRMLAKKPEDRYQTPKELLGDLLNVRKEMLEKA
jgi:serine/threonine protein kinase